MKIRPLIWEPHSVRDNGFYGKTATGAVVVYVYQPVDMGRRRGPYKWAIFQYCEADCGEISHTKTGKPQRYTLPSQAKRAAQEYWKRQMRQLVTP